MPTAAIHTFGCRLNQADAALMADDLRRHGFTLVPWGEPADLLVVNSCVVTAAAAQKTGQALRAARRACPEALLVLAGCSANVEGGRWADDGTVDLVVPNPDKTSLSRFLPGVGAALPAGTAGSRDMETAVSAVGDPFIEPGVGYYPFRTRANLKIQEGCDGECSYCIVPRARGRPRSRAWDDALREAGALVAAGHRELVLTGVNIARYSDGRRRLPDLVEAILALPGDFRVRLSSTEPCPELPAILRLMACEPRICRFLHLPMQYGEDSILARMRRPYTVAEFAESAERAVSSVPGLCLGTDLIVGFPGESDALFATCLQTVRRLPFAYLHVFSYSPRPGTPAAGFAGAVDAATARRRHQAMAEVGREKALAFAGSQVGQVVRVLVERAGKTAVSPTPDSHSALGVPPSALRVPHSALEGWSDNYLRVRIASGAPWPVAGEFCDVRVDRVLSGRHVAGRRCASSAG